jgi:hypothetical protein
MATIYVSEHATMGIAANGVPQVASHPSLQAQSMAITAGSTTLPTPFTGATRFIRVHTDAICSIAIGSSPTAVTTKNRMSAESTEYYGVQPGDNIAVIANT